MLAYDGEYWNTKEVIAVPQYCDQRKECVRLQCDAPSLVHSGREP